MKIIKFAKKAVNTSPIRAFEYEELSKIDFSGKVLDLGGGGVSSYLSLCNGKYDVTSLNIDPKTKPTIVADITKTFPLKDNHFDHAVSMNTFEHIPEFETTFKETSRVLKEGGTFVFTTPFLHQIHASPDDYWRYSATALNNLLAKNGFKAEKIIPLGKGLFTARYSLIYGIIPRLARPLFAAWAWMLDSTLSKISPRYKKMCAEHNYPLGYFVFARKISSNSSTHRQNK
jgi:SAM-dependent methyltransferase